MRRFCFVLLLAILKNSIYGLEWKKLDDLEKSIENYVEFINKFTSSVSEDLQNTTSSSMSFYENVEKVMADRSFQIPSENECKIVFNDTESSKLQFKIQLNNLEAPLRQANEELKLRMGGLYSSLKVYKNVAASKLSSCLLLNVSCQKVNSWKSKALQNLKCRLVPNCREVVSNYREKRSLPNSCGSNYFSCRSGQCISADNVCGGSSTCEDSSDETRNCQQFCFNGYQCQNLKCIDKLRVCDGEDDCGDNSDEEGCTNIKSKCRIELGGFRCSNNKCIDVNKVCDGIDDCTDGSDEGGLCVSACPSDCETSGGVCLFTPAGPICLNKCPPGTAYGTDGCRWKPEVFPSTIQELVEFVARIAARYLSNVSRLERETISILINKMKKCMDDS